MTKKFRGLRAGNYLFRDEENTREVIAIYAGGRAVSFIEYDAARYFVDQVHDLCDDYETRQREA